MKKIKLKNMITMSVAIIVLLFILRPYIELNIDKLNFYGNDNLVNFIDDEGVRIVMNDYPDRIISLDSVHTENLFSLGLDSKVIAVDDKSTMPVKALYKQSFKLGKDVEGVISLNPQIVLITPDISRKYPEYINDIRRSGLTVASISHPKISDLKDYMLRLGRVSGKIKTSERYYEDYIAKINDIEGVTTRNINFYIESSEYGVTTFIDDSFPIKAIKTLGGVNVAKGAMQLYPNTLLADDTKLTKDNIEDVDLYITTAGMGGNKHTVLSRTEFSKTNALINDNIIELPINYLSPTESYFKGIKELKRMIYPEIYDNLNSFVGSDKDLTRSQLCRLAVMYKNMPMYKPSRSEAFGKENHMYGSFLDVALDTELFDNIETAVNMGILHGVVEKDGEYFYPDKPVSRYELSRALFLLDNIDYMDKKYDIEDIHIYEEERIIQTLVDAEVLNLLEGKFKGYENISSQDAKQAFIKLREVNGGL